MVYIQFIIGFILLILGGNVLVSNAVLVAKRFRVSPLLIGLLLIGFGTSLPELTTSLLSVMRKAEGLAVGNVVGSNIANILLVLGASALINPIVIHEKAFSRDALFLGLSTIVLLIALLQGSIGAGMGALMCAVLIFYVVYAYRTDKKHMRTQKEEIRPVKLSRRFHIPTPLAVVLTFCGLILTLLGADFLVKSVVVIAGHWGVSETIIGLTIVAFGTSLPELVTGIIASYKKEGGVVLGNVLGSNIYNALFILGVTALFLPVTVPISIKTDVLVMTAATLLLLFVGWWRGRIDKRLGLLFISFYFAYIIYTGIS